MRALVLFGSGFVGASSLAGLDPVAFSIHTEAFGEVRPHFGKPRVEITDLDVAPTFFGSIESVALAQIGEDRGVGGASVAVTGDASRWNITTFATGEGDSYEHFTRGRGEAHLSATFTAAAGTRVSARGIFTSFAHANEAGWTSTFTLTLLRGTSILRRIEIDHGRPWFEQEDRFLVSLLLRHDDEYTLELRSFASGYAEAGPGLWDGWARQRVDMSFRIIAAPASAAPLAFAGVLAARRRRA